MIPIRLFGFPNKNADETASDPAAAADPSVEIEENKQDVFDRDANAQLWLEEIEGYVKALPLSKYPYVPIGTQCLPEAAILYIET